MTTKCPKNRVNRPAKSKMKGIADRNASEFNQPIAAKGNPVLSHFGAKLNKNDESTIDDVCCKGCWVSFSIPEME